MAYYFDGLKEAMTWLGTQPDVLFMGQAVSCAGTAMSNTLKDVDHSKLLELPVAEEMQLGMSLGLSLQGYVPVSIFPRWNFFLLALNQLVNHLDKYPMMSDFKPKVIIRVGIGSVVPLDPQWQHKGDFTECVRMMCKTITVVRLDHPEDIVPQYQLAYHRVGSTILCEVSDFYNEDFRTNYNNFRVAKGCSNGK